MRYFILLLLAFAALLSNCSKEVLDIEIRAIHAYPDSVFPGDTVILTGASLSQESDWIRLTWFYDDQVLSNAMWIAPKEVGDHCIYLLASDQKSSDIDSIFVHVKDTLGTFIDARDNHLYKWVKIGQQIWMAENLAYLPEVYPGSVGAKDTAMYYVYDYNGYEVASAKQSGNYAKYGVLYNWQAASQGAENSSSVPSGVRGACPDGWHLPSLDEWRALLEPRIQVHPEFLSTSGWIKQNIGTNTTGFNVLPAGYRLPWGGDFVFGAEGMLSLFWTTTDHPVYWITDNLVSVVPFWAVGVTGGHELYSHWVEGLSVRCIKDGQSQ